MAASRTRTLKRDHDVDAIPRPVTAITAATVDGDWEQARHKHRKVQLLYCVRGALTCETDDGVWVVPPESALWIPPDQSHSTRGSGQSELFCLFVAPEVAPLLAPTCCKFPVTPLLREMILSIGRLPVLYALGGWEERLVTAFLDQLSMVCVEHSTLPMPRDPRLRKLARLLLSEATEKIKVGEWASHVGMSERTVNRLLLREVGMSFGRWRRQLHVLLALQRMARGESVQSVALGLGYENASGFITMFRKAVGKSPARYLADRAAATGRLDAAPIAGILLPDRT